MTTHTPAGASRAGRHLYRNLAAAVVGVLLALLMPIAAVAQVPGGPTPRRSCPSRRGSPRRS